MLIKRQEYFPSELNSAVVEPLRHTITALTERGASVVSVSLPSTPYALSAYYVIASAEASSNLARYDGIQYGEHDAGPMPNVAHADLQHTGLRVDPPKTADTKKTANVYAHSRTEGFGPEVQKRILLGTYALTAE